MYTQYLNRSVKRYSVRMVDVKAEKHLKNILSEVMHMFGVRLIPEEMQGGLWNQMDSVGSRR